MLALICIFGFIVLISGCASGGLSSNKSDSIDNHEQASHGTGEVAFDPTQGTDQVKAAYAFALKNQKTLKGFYCICGCMNPTHQPNHDNLAQCFVKDLSSKGKVTYDSHGASCQECQNEAFDIKAWMEEGKDAKYIEKLYDAKYGSNAGAPKNWFKDL